MSQQPPAQLVPHNAGGSGATSPSGSQALPPLATRVFEGLAAVRGPIVVLQGVTGVAYGEAAEVLLPDGSVRRGRVLEASEAATVVEVWDGTAGISVSTAKVRFAGHGLRVPVSVRMLGRTFDGLARPIDGLPAPLPEAMVDANGAPMNPVRRVYPRNLIVTGVSAIDVTNTLVRGQKLPIFTGSGLPHNELAAQIARQAHLLETDEEFAVVFVAMGVKHDDAAFFAQRFRESGAMAVTALFLNLADDPPMERIVAPRAALSLAEHLAFEHGMHVLVILTDMTNYGEALRELSSTRDEVPSRKGYPGYLYSDLASLYERTGMLRGRPGSITQLPILAMPNDDISHPMPDLTGYITEGQLVLSRDLHARGIYPPLNILPSLSRLMKDSIGEGRTRPDHPAVANQLYAAYSRLQDVRSLASVIGADALSARDQRYVEFGQAYEERFLRQRADESRSLDESLDLAWRVLSLLPEDELARVSEDELAERYLADEAQVEDLR
ncbi:MAG: V-type ATP synthase subunit B [Anaerolineae bacterium]|jgi:V/A-type H+-transporting ATPase subunit B